MLPPHPYYTRNRARQNRRSFDVPFSLLTPLNAVSIKDAAVPPFVDHVAESFAGRACCSVFDLYVAFDQRKLDPRSRDMTTFQTPLGTFRLTSIPMGYTNSFQIMHNDVTFILQDEIPETDRKSTRLNSSHSGESRMPSSA